MFTFLTVGVTTFEAANPMPTTTRANSVALLEHNQGDTSYYEYRHTCLPKSRYSAAGCCCSTLTGLRGRVAFQGLLTAIRSSRRTQWSSVTRCSEVMAGVVRVVLPYRMRYIEAKSGCWVGRSDAYKPVHVAGLCFGYRLPTKLPNISYIACLPNSRIYHIPPPYQTAKYIIYRLPTKPTVSPYTACLTNPRLAHISPAYQTLD